MDIKFAIKISSSRSLSILQNEELQLKFYNYFSTVASHLLVSVSFLCLKINHFRKMAAVTSVDFFQFSMANLHFDLETMEPAYKLLEYLFTTALVF